MGKPPPPPPPPPPPSSPPPRNRRRGTDYSALDQPELSWTQWWREQRHSPCVMCPTTVLIIIVIAALSLVGLLFQIPTFVLGLFLSPLMRRMTWFVEFIYPAGIARTVHIALMQWGLNSKVGRGSGVKGKSGRLMPPQHSRSVEQRTEVVKGRVYVHPMPQLLDNVGYLIVCCPPPDSGDGGRKSSILGILVDCGDAKSALAQVELIRDTHYSELQGKPKIAIHSVLCTHKHHDHTAGNRHLLANKKTTATLKAIVGGAVEKVPYCTHPVKNGERVTLPKAGTNDMSELVEIECIAVPSHTRGSIVYALRNLIPNDNVEGGFVSHIFSGDAMFSGGGGVPFESDIETPSDKNVNAKNRNSLVKVTAGRCSIERCFAEVLFRTTSQINVGNGSDSSAVSIGSGHPRRVLLFPGHEYTSDLLLRQLDPSNEHHGHWTKLPPAIFFETASQYLISSHRRTLPKNGRLLTVPSSLDRELRTNPHFRALKKRGDHLITAVRVWYRYMSRTRKEEAQNAALNLVKSSSSSAGNVKSFNSFNIEARKQGLVRSSSSSKTPSTESSWTMDINDINRSVFSTVYSSDLDAVISDLQSGKVSGENAAKRLLDMRTKLEEPVVTRRPIPGTLPSEKNMYLAVVALALLGSPPSGMTVQDGLAMNLPIPVDSSDEIIISKQRIISMLALLGLLDGPSSKIASDNKENEDEPCIVEMVEILWREAHFDSEAINSSDLVLASDEGNMNEAADPEESVGDKEDGVELGLLKMTLNGAALNQPSWFKKYCLPCGTKADTQPAIPVPASVAKMRRSGGELVRHDIHACPMCRDVVTGSAFVSDGALISDADEEEEELGQDRAGGSDDDDFERVQHRIHQSPLMEGCGDSSSEGEGSGVELQIISSL